VIRARLRCRGIGPISKHSHAETVAETQAEAYDRWLVLLGAARGFRLARDRCTRQELERNQQMSRDRKGRFVTGGKPGPGRPPGSRNKLAEDFLTDLCEDWKKHGSSVIADVRSKHPAVYLRTVASLVPRDEPPAGPALLAQYEQLTNRELVDLLQEECRLLLEGSDRQRGELNAGSQR
jgi:hypothetical protein